MASSDSKQSESLNNLLTEVISVRRAAPTEYELKLKRFYANRANQLQRGVFNGAKIPVIKKDVGDLNEILERNEKLTQMAEYNVEQYLYAKEISNQLTNKLQQVAKALKEAAEIEKTVRES